ncbi:pyroglutamylated RFamide peptide receptor-like isoform X2 [Stylophora pistillata]|nr:pyroglutamylated RFamide peptide receptor-like isoform X2 [Stylophora pistillata]
MNYLLLNLAICDVLFAIFITPKIIVSYNISHPDGVTGVILCKLLTGGNMAWVSGAFSVIILVTIAVERYHTVRYAFDPNRKLTKRKLKVIVLCSWIFAVFFNLPLFLVRTFEMAEANNYCVQIWPEKWMSSVYCVAWLFLVVASAVTMTVLYSRVIYTLWHHPNDGNPLTYKQQGVLRVRKRVTLMVISVSVIFAVCWGAESVEYALRITSNLNISFVHIATVDMMVLFNSAVNPFVYALLNHQFRQKIKEVMSCTRLVAHRPRAETAKETKL